MNDDGRIERAAAKNKEANKKYERRDTQTHAGRKWNEKRPVRSAFDRLS